VLGTYAKTANTDIVQPPDLTLGSHYELIASTPAEKVRWVDALNDLVRAGYLASWRVDPDGITRFTPRASIEVTGRATPLRRQGDISLTTYGIDDPATFLPGNTIEGVTINRITIREQASKLEADVYTTPEASAPPLRETIRRIAWDRLSRFLRTYVVNSVEPDRRLNLSPPADARHLPELSRVEQWSVGGALVKAKVGAEVLVLFRDQNCTRPIVLGFAPGAPDTVTLDADHIEIGS
jgi:hypothetical protein